MKQILLLLTSLLLSAGCTDDRIRITLENTLSSDRIFRTG